MNSEVWIGWSGAKWLAALSVILLGLTALRAVHQRSLLTRFATANLYGRLGLKKGVFKLLLSSVLLALVSGSIALGLLDLRWGKSWEEVPQTGIEVMICLDVSRSMLAEDATPNRLERAKQQIRDLLEEMPGDRIGLVIFAGRARQVVPLTSHHEDLKTTLNNVKPESLPEGGSRLGNAIQMAADGFLDKTSGNKTILVFTDGEDQESNPATIAKTLYQEKGIRIFTIGLGDSEHGSRIPKPNGKGFVVYHGAEVWSKLNSGILTEIAQQSNGAYIPAGTKRVNMHDVYQGYIADIQKSDFGSAKINLLIPRFQWFVLPGITLLIVEIWFGTSHKKGGAR